MDSSHKLITIIGNVGAGKSTLTELLTEKLTAKKVDADSLFQENPFFEDFVKNRERWAMPCELWFMKKRIDILKNCRADTQEQHVVVDSGLIMSFVYAYSGLSQQEWDLYWETYEALSKDEASSDVLIYLKASVPFLLDRIKQRGREHELKHYTQELLQGLEDSMEHIVKTIKGTSTHVLELDIETYDFRQSHILDTIVKGIVNAQPYDFNDNLFS